MTPRLVSLEPSVLAWCCAKNFISIMEPKTKGCRLDIRRCLFLCLFVQKLILLRRLLLMFVLLLSSDCSGLCLGGALLWSRPDGVCLKSHTFSRGYILHRWLKVTADGSCLSLLSLSLCYKTCSLKCLFSFSLVSKDIWALKTMMLREYISFFYSICSNRLEGKISPLSCIQIFPEYQIRY